MFYGVLLVLLALPGARPAWLSWMLLALGALAALGNVLGVPLCFADASPGFSLTMEEVEQMLDGFVSTEGRPEVVPSRRQAWLSATAAPKPVRV